MLNVIILMGRATKDPVFRQISAQGDNPATSLANFDIAVDNIRKESDGSQSSSFFKVTCFGRIADNVSTHVRKGSKIAVHGSIQQRNYISSNGEKRTTYDVIADSVEFLDPKPTQEDKPEAPAFVDEESIPEDPKEAKPAEQKEPAFDPYTGKPLKPKTKK